MPNPLPQIVELSAGLGVDTESDERQVQKLVVAENVYIDKAGRLKAAPALVELSNRTRIRSNDDFAGVGPENVTKIAALYGDAQETAPLGLIEDGPSKQVSPSAIPMTFEGGYGLHRWSEFGGWVYVGRKSPAHYKMTPIARTHQPRISASGTNGFYYMAGAVDALDRKVVVYSDPANDSGSSSALKADVIDKDGNRFLTELEVNGQGAASGVRCFRLVADGTTYFVVGYRDDVSLDLGFWLYDAANDADSNRGTIQNALVAADQRYFDVIQSRATPGLCYMVYHAGGAWVTATGSITAGVLSTAAFGVAVAGMTEVLGLQLVVAPSGAERLLILGWDSATGDVKVQVRNAAGGVVATTTIYTDANTAPIHMTAAGASIFDTGNGGYSVVAITEVTTATARLQTSFVGLDFGGTVQYARYKVPNIKLVSIGFTYGSIPYFVVMAAHSGKYTRDGETGYNYDTNRSDTPTYFLVSIRESQRERDYTGGLASFPWVGLPFKLVVDGTMLVREAEAPRCDQVPVGTYWQPLLDASIDGSRVYVPGLRTRSVDGGSAIFYLNDTILMSFDFGPQHYNADSLVKCEARAGGQYILPGLLPQFVNSDRSFEAGFLTRPFFTKSSSAAGGSLTAGGAYGHCVVYEWYGPDGKLHRSIPSTKKVATIGGGDNRVVMTIDTYVLLDRDARRWDVRIAIYRTAAGGSLYFKVATIANDPTVGILTYNDTTADTTITANAALYTEGGELSNDSPRPMKFIVSRVDKAFYVSPDQPTRVYCSKPLTSGVAPEFSDALYVDIQAAGNITGLGMLDDSVVVFSPTDIFTFFGVGPNALGLGEFSPVRRLETDAGCEDPHSIVGTPDGLFFKSSKGIRMLSRSQQVDIQIGAAVREFDSQRIVASQRLAKRPQLRFFTDHGGTLIYDYLHGAWTTVEAARAHDGMNTTKGFVTALANGLRREQENGSVKWGEPVIETGWLTVGARLGLSYIWRLAALGELAGAFTVHLYKDYESAPFQSIKFEKKVGRQQVRIKPKVTRVEVMKFRIVGFGELSKLALISSTRTDTTFPLSESDSR